MGKESHLLNIFNVFYYLTMYMIHLYHTFDCILVLLVVVGVCLLNMQDLLRDNVSRNLYRLVLIKIPLLLVGLFLFRFLLRNCPEY